MAGVSIDRVSFARRMRETGGAEVHVRFTPTGPPPPHKGPLWVIFSGAQATATGKMRGEVRGLQTEPIPSLNGAQAALANVPTQQALDQWLDLVAERLTQAGWQGQLNSPEPDPDLEIGPILTPMCLTTVLFTTGWVTDETTRGLVPRPGWEHDPHLAQALGRLVETRVEPGAEPYVNKGGPELRIDADKVGAQVADLLSTPIRKALPKAGAKAPQQEFIFVFDHRGRVIVADWWTEPDPDAQQAWHERLLRDAAPWCEYGFSRHTHPGWAGARVESIVAFPPEPPHINYSHFKDDRDGYDPTQDSWPYYQTYRHRDSDHVPDAYGLQLLGPGHLVGLGGPLPTDRWEQTPTDSPLTLVKHTQAPD